MLAPGTETDLARFAIGFDQRDRARLHALWERVFDSNQWSEGSMARDFETAWGAWNGLEAVSCECYAVVRQNIARILRPSG